MTKSENKGDALGSTAKHLFNLTSTWPINDVFDLWLQHEYQSGRPRYLESQTGDALNIQKQTNNQFSGYHLFNLWSSYQLNDRMRMNAAVNNLLDKNFTEYMDYYELNGDVQKHISTFLSVLLCLERLFLGATTAVYSLTIFNI